MEGPSTTSPRARRLRWTVYVISRGRTRYVGRTINSPKQRLHNHWYAAKAGRGSVRMLRWLKPMIAANRMPEIAVISRHRNKAAAARAEAAAIVRLRQEGFHLINHPKYTPTIGAPWRQRVVPLYARVPQWMKIAVSKLARARGADIHRFMRELYTRELKRAGAL